MSGRIGRHIGLTDSETMAIDYELREQPSWQEDCQGRSEDMMAHAQQTPQPLDSVRWPPAMTSDALRTLLSVTLIPALLAACEPIPNGSPAWTRPDGAGGQAMDGGIVELDSNTDPRFVHSDWRDFIGVLQARGQNVYLNGAPVRGRTRIFNNAHVRTGPQSRARIDFRGGRAYECRISILDLRTGNLSGATAACSHQVETAQGAARATPGQTDYRVSVFDQRTRITVVRGTVDVWLRGDPSRRVTVGASETVTLTPSSIIGPEGEGRAPGGQPDRSRNASCARYARTAVAQNEENLRRNCGFSGPAWQSDYRTHFDWCMSGDNWRSLAPREERARTSRLGQCGRAPRGPARFEPEILRPEILRVPPKPPRPAPAVD
jgi:hypothetical protein